MSYRRSLVVMAAIAASAVLLSSSVAGCRRGGAAIGKAAPAGTLRLLGSGREVSFPADLQGRAVMLCFFSPG